jgi:hypothetical protein
MANSLSTITITKKPGKLSRYSDGLRPAWPGFDSRQDFSLFHRVQTESRAQSASYPVGTGALSLVIRRPRRETDHSPPFSAEVNNGEAIPPLTQVSTWRGA